MTPLPSRSSLFFPFQFLLRNARQIARRIALPYLAGALAIYGFFAAYITELQAYLLHPQDSASGRILGIAAAALLVLVLLHSIVMARVAQLALGLKNPPNIFLGISRAEWRLYTANLQFCIVVLIFMLALYGLHAATTQLGWLTGPVLEVIQGAILFGLTARIWFLLAPICAVNAKGEVLMMAWQRSAGRFWRIALILISFLLIAYLAQVAVALGLHALGLIAPIPSSASLADYVASYHDNLLPMAMTTNIAYIVFTVLTAAASVQIYAEEPMAGSVASS